MIKYFTYLICLILAIPAIVEPGQEIEVGQQINLMVKANLQGDVNIDMPKAFLPGHNVVNGVEREYDQASRSWVTFMYSSKSGSFTRSGTYEIGPAYVRQGNKVYKSNKVKVVVSKSGRHQNTCKSNQIRKSAFAVINLSKKEVYVGEPVVAAAKMYSKFQPDNFDDYRPYEVSKGNEKHALPGPREVTLSIEKVNGQERISFDLDKQVIFPVTAGNLYVQPFQITLIKNRDSYPLKSDAPSIKVKALPTPKPNSFQGGVGKFELERQLLNQPKTQGDVVSMTLVLKGYGNLHDLSAPELNLPDGFKIYGDPEVKEDMHFSEKGCSGKLEVTYHIEVLNAGVIEFPEFNYSFFDPKSEEYKILKLPELVFDIEPLQGAIADVPGTNAEPEEKEQFVIEEEASPWYASNIVKWVGGSLPVLAFLFLVMTKTKKKEEEPVLQEIVEEEKPRRSFDKENALRILMAKQAENDFVGYFDQMSKELNKAVAILAGYDEYTILSTEEKNQLFKEIQLNPEIQTSVDELIQTGQSVRFGMQQPPEELSEYTKKARKIFDALT